MSDPIRLYSDGLLSKWGFGDGDCLDEVLWDRCDELGLRADGDEHAVLIRAVREYLLPALAEHHDVVVFEIDTIHNPIRADTIDGIEIPPFDSSFEMALTPEYVDVPFEVLWQWYLETLPPPSVPQETTP
jgi:hypothetical protein